MSFYSNFLSMCNSIGKTPSKVVTEVGLKKSAVTRWKTGGKPTDATMQKIADYFGVSVSDLLSEKENCSEPLAPGEAKSRLLALIDSMTEEQCEKLGDIIEAVVKTSKK